MLKTLGYKTEVVTEVMVGETYYFAELWDGFYDGEETLESGAIAMYDEENEDVIVSFTVLKTADYVGDALVKVTAL